MVARLDPRTWPIRWQLTALNVGVHAATLVVLSAIFLAQLDGALVGLTAENMRDKVRLLAEDRRPPPDEAGRPPARRSASAALKVADGHRAGGPGGPDGGRPPFTLPRFASFAVDRLSGPDSGVLVFDTSGNLVQATQTYEDEEPWPLPPPEQVAQALAGGERSSIVRQASHRTLLLAVPIISPRGQNRRGAGAGALAGADRRRPGAAVVAAGGRGGYRCGGRGDARAAGDARGATAAGPGDPGGAGDREREAGRAPAADEARRDRRARDRVRHDARSAGRDGGRAAPVRRGRRPRATDAADGARRDGRDAPDGGGPGRSVHGPADAGHDEPRDRPARAAGRRTC